MNPIPSVEQAWKLALEELIPVLAPELAGVPVCISLDNDVDTMPQIIVRAGAQEAIAFNATFAVTVALGIITSANPEESQPATAYRQADALGRLVWHAAFRQMLDAAAAGQDSPWKCASPPRTTEAANVQVEGEYSYLQAATVVFHAQF